MTFRPGDHPDELISASLTGDMTDAERSSLESHLASCEHCRDTLAAFTQSRKLLSGMRPTHRQCIVLSDIQDMNAHQIGELMGMSYGAVRTLLCRARGEMRRELALEGIGA